MTKTADRPDTARIIGEARLTTKELAAEAGIPYSTVNNYRSGQPMPRRARLQVASVLVAHAERLREMARDLSRDEG